MTEIYDLLLNKFIHWESNPPLRSYCCHNCHNVSKLHEEVTNLNLSAIERYLEQVASLQDTAWLTLWFYAGWCLFMQSNYDYGYRTQKGGTAYCFRVSALATRNSQPLWHRRGPHWFSLHYLDLLEATFITTTVNTFHNTTGELIYEQTTDVITIKQK